MADQILTAVVANTEYSLPAATRNALLEKSATGRRHRRALLIEQQRNAFIAIYGDPFGQAEQSAKKH